MSEAPSQGSTQLRSVCVFCGSQSGARGSYADLADSLGRTLARRGIRLVYGGGDVGLMGILAQAALDAGGHVTGVIPRRLVDRELAHRGVDELVITETMHERKAEMARRADAFLVLPGGLGTMEETFEVLTWSQIGFHAKPCGLLDVDDFWAPLGRFLDHVVEEGFLRPQHRANVLLDTDVDELLDALAAFRPEGAPARSSGVQP